MNRPGFTLIEILVATAIFSTIVMIGFAGLSQTQIAKIRGRTLTEFSSASRFIFEQLTTDLRNAVAVSGGECRQTAPCDMVLPTGKVRRYFVAEVPDVTPPIRQLFLVENPPASPEALHGEAIYIRELKVEPLPSPLGRLVRQPHYQLTLKTENRGGASLPPAERQKLSLKSSVTLRNFQKYPPVKSQTSCLDKNPPQGVTMVLVPAFTLSTSQKLILVMKAKISEPSLAGTVVFENLPGLGRVSLPADDPDVPGLPSLLIKTVEAPAGQFNNLTLTCEAQAGGSEVGGELLIKPF